MIYIEYMISGGVSRVYALTAAHRVLLEKLVREDSDFEYSTHNLDRISEHLDEIEHKGGLTAVAEALLEQPGDMVCLKDHEGKRYTFYGWSCGVEHIQEYQ